jgi:Cdc6-like AAA superfamily ATPase
MEISKKQNSLREDIIAKDKYEIYVLGSTQSGKTFIISEALIEYSQALHNYDPNKQYYGAIIGWTISALDGNIVEALKLHLNSFGLKNNRDYKLVWKNEEKSISLFNIKYFF